MKTLTYLLAGFSGMAMTMAICLVLLCTMFTEEILASPPCFFRYLIFPLPWSWAAIIVPGALFWAFWALHKRLRNKMLKSERYRNLTIWRP
jgi:uncharacterized BrkB/YihY/UPF0761 family membrane protein